MIAIILYQLLGRASFYTLRIFFTEFGGIHNTRNSLLHCQEYIIIFPTWLMAINR